MRACRQRQPAGTDPPRHYQPAVAVGHDGCLGETSWRHAAAGESGMLLVRGPNVFGGYLGRDEQPFISFEGEMWHRTGDLVSRDTDGCLTFKGRLRRFIKIGGEMISLLK